MRRVSSFITGLIVLLLGAEIAVAASVTISAASIEAAPGGDVVVPITVSGADGMGPLQFDLTYDPTLLEPVDSAVEPGAALPGALIEFNVVEPGRIRVAMISGEAIDGDAEVLRVGYAVIGASGQACKLGLENARAWDHERNLEMLVSMESGSLSVVSASAGMMPWLIGLVIVIVLGVLAAIVKRVRTRGHGGHRGHGQAHPA